MSALVLNDGYVFTARLERVGPWDAPTVRYRPALAEDILEYLHQRDLVSGKSQLKPIVEFLARHLVGWDIKDAKGDVMPATPDNLRRLPIGYLNQILDHVMGYAKAEAETDAKNSAGG